jgi:hypothetical protein
MSALPAALTRPRFRQHFASDRFSSAAAQGLHCPPRTNDGGATMKRFWAVILWVLTSAGCYDHYVIPPENVRPALSGFGDRQPAMQILWTTDGPKTMTSDTDMTFMTMRGPIEGHFSRIVVGKKSLYAVPVDGTPVRVPLTDLTGVDVGVKDESSTSSARWALAGVGVGAIVMTVLLVAAISSSIDSLGSSNCPPAWECQAYNQGCYCF